MKWPAIIIPSGGVTRGGLPEATGRMRKANIKTNDRQERTFVNDSVKEW